MCAEQPQMAPDFIFLEEGGQQQEINLNSIAWVSLEKVESIKRWNPHNQNALLEIVVELLQLYRNYQSALLLKHPSTRFQFEYDTIMALNIEGIEWRKDSDEVIQEDNYIYISWKEIVFGIGD